MNRGKRPASASPIDWDAMDKYIMKTDMPVSMIARRLTVSRSAVTNRMHKLGYVTISNDLIAETAVRAKITNEN
mgnify:CR=1 FL=1